MGRDIAAAARDQGADPVHGLHGVGHEPRSAVGAGEGRGRGRPADGAGREQVPELEVGSERSGSVRHQLRQLGRMGFPREEVCRFRFFFLLFLPRTKGGTIFADKITGMKPP